MNTHTVTPFLPCNDAARIAGKPIVGWDVRDAGGVVVDCFDAHEEHLARARADELNHEAAQQPQKP